MPSGFDANHPACCFLGFLLWLFPAIIHEPRTLFVLLKERACLESRASLVAPVGKKSACSAGNQDSISGSERSLDPGNGKIHPSRKWQPAPVFLSEESHGQRSLAGYSPWCLKESDTT